MDFLEIENRKTDKPVNMSYTQFHDYYELYFLIKGSREVFVENELFLLQSGSLCVIPPFSMHKTEGSSYERTNVYVSVNLLNKYENALLKRLGSKTAFTLTKAQTQFIYPILSAGVDQKIADRQQRNNFVLSLVKAILAYIDAENLTPLLPVSATRYSRQTDSLILQVVATINDEYREKITLDSLHKRFFVSKNTLCKRFHEHMNCSVIEYVTYVRINKAKMYLSTTEKSVSEIADLCGFPSANYFGIIFKKNTGISPLNYRKKQ